MELDLAQLSKLVTSQGGLQTVINKQKWAKIADDLKIPKSVQSRDERLQAFYYRYLLSYDMLQPEEKASDNSIPSLSFTCFFFCVCFCFGAFNSKVLMACTNHSPPGVGAPYMRPL